MNGGRHIAPDGARLPVIDTARQRARRRRAVVALLAVAVLFLVACATAAAVKPAWHAGDNWLWQNPRPQGATLYDVEFTTDLVGWAVGGAGTFMRTTDGGATWTPRTLPVPTATFFDLVEICFAAPSTGWVLSDEGNVYRTTDAGKTWSEDWSGVGGWTWGLDFADADAGWIVGAVGVIVRSTDGGAAWVPQTSGVTTDLHDVFALSAQIAWAVGDAGAVLTTTDAGVTWTPQVSGTSEDLRAVFFLDALTGWAAGYGDTVLRTVDGGVTWTPDTTGNEYHRNQDIVFTSATHGFVASSYSDGWTDDGMVLETADGGDTWTPVVESRDCSFCAVASPAGRTVAMGSGGRVYVKADGAWGRVGSGSGYRLDSVSMATGARGWACGYNGTDLRTVDGGATWTPRSSWATGALTTSSL